MPDLDQLFLLNLALDALLLWSLVRLLGGRGDLGIVLAAAIGAMLATLAVLPGLAWAGSPPVAVAAALGMVALVRRPRSPFLLGRDCLLLLGLAALLAGLCLLFRALLPALGGFGMLGAGAGAFLALERVAEGWLRRQHQRTGVREVEVEIGGRQRRLRCLVDSGCLARDPMTDLPVMVAELHSLAPLFPGALRRALLEPALIAAQEVAGAAEGGDLARRLRLVEVQTVGRGSEWLIGFRGTVRAEGAPAQGAVVLITTRRLSRRGVFEAVAPLEFWNGEEGTAS